MMTKRIKLLQLKGKRKLMKDNKNKQWFINTDHITDDRTIQLSGQHV